MKDETMATEPTHCRHGHEMTEANTIHMRFRKHKGDAFIEGKTKRQCRECKRLSRPKPSSEARGRRARVAEELAR
jgi:hypothetical protein